MTIKRTDKGWLADIQPGGRGSKRYRKTFDTRAEAQRWERYMRAQVDRAPDWMPPRQDKRRLSELVRLWYEGHGVQLRDGKRRCDALLRCVQAMGDPIASDFAREQFVIYRAQRRADGLKDASLNREHAYMRALFGELARLGHWTAPNPMQGLRLIRERQHELAYLSAEQIEHLLAVLEGDVRRIVLLCLATGARWSEAERLRAEDVTGELVTFHGLGTKSGRSRSVPIAQGLADLIRGKRRVGRLFRPSYHAFRTGIERAGICLPAGQLTHVLRHTFASHFMQQGGNLLVLQRILGHSTVTVTMRYAHFAPDHLREAVRLNPVAALTLG
ncbi:site-specific recombinase XerD [Plasticicumulans lactativorans]|uniref:Site-specific recombinase XerD n=1 Tax=Plasticicumulans lactativorans TaxID=1133106 RepID=A0A4R2L5K5_9GAMM|nr:tyrosine-type recombinase/integrase [Plasticicumulans lactativorans]TCO81102.1 site-specific recombinase XerD [Plasticicumulans lactativorans]